MYGLNRFTRGFLKLVKLRPPDATVCRRLRGVADDIGTTGAFISIARLCIAKIPRAFDAMRCSRMKLGTDHGFPKERKKQSVLDTSPANRLR
jgi:hypothetical protein